MNWKNKQPQLESILDECQPKHWTYTTKLTKINWYNSLGKNYNKSVGKLFQKLVWTKNIPTLKSLIIFLCFSCDLQLANTFYMCHTLCWIYVKHHNRLLWSDSTTSNAWYTLEFLFSFNPVGRTKKTYTSNVSVAIPPLSYLCSGKWTSHLLEQADQHSQPLAMSADRMLIFQKARSKEAGCETGFCRTRSCTHRPKVGRFLQNWPILNNFQPLCTQLKNTEDLPKHNDLLYFNWVSSSNIYTFIYNQVEGSTNNNCIHQKNWNTFWHCWKIDQRGGNCSSMCINVI